MFEKLTEKIYRLKVPFENIYTSVFALELKDGIILADCATTESDAENYIIPAIGQLQVAFETCTSWGYYNNMTKQEPPCDWGITEGEDRFFAHRMAMGLGISVKEIPFEEQYYLQGMEKEMTFNNKRWLRVASLYPETVDFVRYYVNDKLIYTSFDEPFSLYFTDNWYHKGVELEEGDKVTAEIHLRDGRVIKKAETLKNT